VDARLRGHDGLKALTHYFYLIGGYYA